jgi:DUF1680 family protein
MPGDLYSYEDADIAIPFLKINGKDEYASISGGYISITREWQKGDVVSLSMPMNIRRVNTKRDVEANQNKIAFERGPIVYCAEEVDNKGLSNIKIPMELSMQPKQETIMGQSVIVLTGKVKNNDLKLIPYYIWSNRGVNTMKVWMDAEGKHHSDLSLADGLSMAARHP